MGANEPVVDRRATDHQLLRAIHGVQKSLDARHTENKSNFQALEEKVDRILGGFPGEDPDAHRRYHESIIEWRELRNRMVRETLIHVTKVGAWAGLGWLLYAIWTVIKMEVKK